MSATVVVPSAFTDTASSVRNIFVVATSPLATSRCRRPACGGGRGDRTVTRVWLHSGVFTGMIDGCGRPVGRHREAGA